MIIKMIYKKYYSAVKDGLSNIKDELSNCLKSWCIFVQIGWRMCIKLETNSIFDYGYKSV